MQSRWVSASSLGFPENSGLNKTSLSVLLAVPAVQVDVPVTVGLVVLLELELEGVEVMEYLALVVLALPYLIHI